jgi:hypothetical protein
VAEKPKSDEETHFRVDEHERLLSKFEEIFGIPERARPSGGVSERIADHDQRIRVIEQMFSPENLALLMPAILKAMGEDAAADKGVSEKLDALISRFDTLVSVLLTPTTRVATLDLPSGPAVMTVRETKQ